MYEFIDACAWWKSCCPERMPGAYSLESLLIATVFVLPLQDEMT
jgi:hypothetical protein